MIKKIFIVLVFTILIFTSLCTTVCYAQTTQITEDDLKNAISKLAADNYINDLNVVMEKNIMTIRIEGEEYTLNYDLTEEPTFISTININQNTTPAEMDKMEGQMAVPLICYAAIANMEGIDFEDSIYYFLISYMREYLDALQITMDDYSNLDTSNIEDMLEYYKDMYEKLTVISDSKGINSYTYSFDTEYKEEDMSYNLSFSFTINPDADFSQLNGYLVNLVNDYGNIIESGSVEDLGNSFNTIDYSKYLTKTNNVDTNNEGDNNEDNNNEDKQNTANSDKLPKTGLEINNSLVFLFVVIDLCAVSLIILLVTLKMKK